ncbi:acyl-ACP desaturase [Parasediminibacterium sp. JCM 36343]|uniref:acyl-ACP desaturase n=1 Tax=Parasediminibacterium sp. JCM 36343 TaxID=3374279 RepID=UPI00397D4974
MQQTESNEISKNMEVIGMIEGFVSETINTNLVNPDECWQPTDFLPDLTQEDAIDQIIKLRERSATIPDSIITSLVGNMITEEALPSYQTYFNLIVNSERELTSENGWVRWSRAWTAEENRHGDLLNKYLYLSGRCDMKAVEQTIHRLIYNGFNPNTNNDPYQAIVYTSFQERATKISHVNTGKLADKAGDNNLSRICKTIAGDEARHEKAYKAFMSKIFEIDPNGALAAFDKMMRKQITMPAVLMDHGGKNPNLFADFSAITQKIGVYTTWDYASIIEHLVALWKIETLTGLKDGASKAQEYLCTLAARYKRIAERMKVPDDINLSWLAPQQFSF